MSVPLSIQFRAVEAPQLQQTPHTGIYGTSPGSASTGKHQSGGSQARKLCKRIQWDSSLDEKEWTVGVLKTREQAERKSGAEAWSLRVQSTVVEHNFTDFVAKYDREGEEMPFHRIAWFKQNGVLVWEAEHLRHKLGDQHHPPAHPGSGSSNPAGLSVSPALGNSLLGCSPPTGSFMARLAAAAGGPLSVSAGPNLPGASSGSFTGLPPRCTNSPLEGVGNSLAQHGTPHQQHGWRPHRLSGTDLGPAGTSSSWCAAGTPPLRETPSPWPGPGTTAAHVHVGFANGHAGGPANSAGSSHISHAHSGHMTPSPLLGSSPSSSSMPACSTAGPSSTALLGTSPRVMYGSWGPGDGAAGHSRSSSAGGVAGGHLSARGAGPEGSALSFMSASPAGSCSSSWTGTSPLAAAVAAGCSSLPLPAALRGSSGGGCGSNGWPLGGGSLPAGGLAAAMAAVGGGGVVVPGAAAGELVGQEAEEPVLVLADYSQLPEKCWMDILQRLGVRELCCAARVNTILKALTARTCLWSSAYERLFGTPAPSDWSSPTVKRLCRRSELRASRWLEADVEARTVGFNGTYCCQLDESKVVSGDGCAVRLWAHESGRRIATLRGHSGRVTSVAFDDERILSGCSQGTVKLWSMDELKLSKTLRHHTGPVSATLLLRGMPISGSKDGMVCLWDANAPNSPIVVLEAGGPVHTLQLLEERDYLISGSNALGVWDMNTTQLMFTLDAPTATPSSSPGLSISSSAASLAATAAAAAAGTSAAAAAAAAADQDSEDDEDLLQNWLMQDDESDSDLSDEEEALPVGVAAAAQQQHHQAAGAAAATAGVGQGGSGSRSGAASAPWTSISCHGNLLAAGNAAGVVLWDVRTQEAVGSIPAGGAFSGGRSPAGSPSKRGCGRSSGLSCVGVQLDDWRLVTGFRQAGSSGGGCGSNGGSNGGSSSMNACWWSSGGEGLLGEEGPWGGARAGHSLEVYDIRAAASFSTAAAAGGSAAGAGGASSSGSSCSGRAGLWTATPVMSLPVPNRITCFQFHGQQLLVGQEGADCCLLSFHPPGSRSGHAAAAWGYGAAGGGSRPGSCGYATGMAAGASPGGPYVAGASPGAGGQGCGEEVGGSGGGKKGKKGGTKVPAKKQTRYPKRATR